MASTLHYKSNLRDVFFNLFEMLDVEKNTLGKGPFTSMDGATAKEMLHNLEKLAVNELAASFAEGDRVPLKLDDKGNVTLPEGIKKSLKAWFDGEWHRLEVPERLDGYGAPPSVCWAGMELCTGANPVTTFYQFGSFIARVIDALGTDSQKKRFVKNAIEKRWGGTMQLTEPNAGSDVGEGKTKARHVKDDVWELEGTKCFITNGDYDFPENIVHLVLARPEGSAGGTKGLSLFIVPKFNVVDDSGTLGERNGIKVVSIEKKMGIKASATCVMELGGDKPCRGYLMGEVHDGIRQMFKVIEQARMSIGVKSMATLSTAYLNALAYAKDRVQGPDLLKATDKASPRVRIIQHPDVRRQLMLQKSLAEGMRALIMYNAGLQDQIEIAGGHGAPEARELDKRNDLMLPLIKGYCSEKAYEVLATSLQVFGGSGYTQDWPIEQYIRDQKIDTLYEGTTHIQALDLVFRKIARDGGATMMALLGEVQAFAEGSDGGDALKGEREALSKALGQLQGIFGVMMPRMGESLYHVGLHANRILFSLSEVLIAWLLTKHAVVALKKLPEASPADKHFYEGKVASARFFVKEVLPEVALHKKIIEGGDLALMELDEGAF
jgi:alkylation response protein AidB-like acyl-CoA dehydrogenase